STSLPLHSPPSHQANTHPLAQRYGHPSTQSGMMVNQPQFGFEPFSMLAGLGVFKILAGIGLLGCLKFCAGGCLAILATLAGVLGFTVLAAKANGWRKHVQKQEQTSR